MDASVITRFVRAHAAPASTGSSSLAEAAPPPPARLAASLDVLPRLYDAPPSARGFRVEERWEARSSTLLAIGELDESAVGPFEVAVSGLVGRGRPIAIDLGGLIFIDSCGLWSISSICSACRQRGIAIRLLPGPPSVQNVFEVTGLYDLLPFTERLPAETG